MTKWNPYEALDPEKTLKFLRETAERISADYDDYTLAEDMAQEAWMWIGEHPVQASTWWFDADDGKRKFAWRNFRQDMAKVMRALANKDRLAARGLDEDDQVTYGRKQVERHLPYVWHNEVLAAVGDVNEVKSKVDPALGGDSMVSAMDVRKAFAEVIGSPSGDGHPSDLHKVMFLSYALGWTQEEIGEQLGVSQPWVSKLRRQGVDAIVRFLSGPELMPNTTWRDGPGTRGPRERLEV